MLNMRIRTIGRFTTTGLFILIELTPLNFVTKLKLLLVMLSMACFQKEKTKENDIAVYIEFESIIIVLRLKNTIRRDYKWVA